MTEQFEPYTTNVCTCECGGKTEVNSDLIGFPWSCDKALKCKMQVTTEIKKHKAFYCINKEGHKIYTRIE